MALTDRAIAKMTWDGRSNDFRPDGPGGLPNFGVRVYESGRKTFVVGYRLPGRRKQQWKTLGVFPVLNTKLARDEARRFLLEVRDGHDPKRKSLDEDISVRDFAEIYLGLLERDEKSSLAESRRRFEKHVYPELGTYQLAQVRRADISRLLEKIASSPGRPRVEANRVVQLLRTMFNKAEQLGYVPEGTPNPTKGIKLFREQARTRYLTSEEILRLNQALAEEGVHIRCLVQLLLILGLRKQELLQLQWKDLELNDVGDSFCYVGNTKNGRDLTLALPTLAAQLFQQIPRVMRSPWVFPSPIDPSRPMADFRRQWNRARKKAGIKDATVHDLRRTCGSIMVQNGVPLEHVAQVLNHRNPEITRVYARLSEDTQKAALETAAGALENILSG